MNFFQSAQLYLIIGFFFFVLIVGAVAILYMLSMKKAPSMAEVNYDYFNRKDSLEYVKFDEIISSRKEDILKGAGVIVRNRNTFISAISVVGFNFYSSDYYEQEKTIVAMTNLFDTLEHPVQFRQTSKAIDISYNIGVFEKIREDLRNEILELNSEKDRLLALANDNIDDDAVSKMYLDQHKKAIDRIHLLDRQYDEASEMIGYMKEMSDASNNVQQIHNIIFSYDYDANQFTNQMPREEIVRTAMNALDSRAASLIQSIVRCGCSARRCTAEELIDLLRRHTHPITANDTSVKEQLDTDLTSLFVSSDTLLISAENRLSEEAYMKAQKELLEKRAEHDLQLAEELKREDLISQKKANEILNKNEEMAKRMVGLI